MVTLFEEMRLSVLEGEEKQAVVLAEKAIREKVDLVQAMNEGFLKGIREAGELYAEGEYYLPELVCSADAMKAALAILDPELAKSATGFVQKERILLATVQGDIHDIGKTIVGAMLTAAGYEVHDLGSDVANDRVLEAIKTIKPEVLGLSALLTTTMEEQRIVIARLNDEKLRDKVKVIVGGAPANSEWANRIGADGYADNAMDAVRLVKQLLRVNHEVTR
jgi:corrinoid protein of di/trimethylamine methyltransferase